MQIGGEATWYYVSSFLFNIGYYLQIKRAVKYLNRLGKVLQGLYDPLASVTTQAQIVIHDCAVTQK